VYADVTECNMRQIDGHRTIRCELMAIKQKDRRFVVTNSEPGKKFVENGVHCCFDTFFLDGIQMR